MTVKHIKDPKTERLRDAKSTGRHTLLLLIYLDGRHMEFFELVSSVCDDQCAPSVRYSPYFTVGIKQSLIISPQEFLQES